jgi:hypothetical protein
MKFDRIGVFLMTFKIQRSYDRESFVVSLSGRLELKYIPELQKLMDSEAGNIILDLRELKLVDRESIEFLTRSEAKGIVIKNCPEHIREWISKTKLNRD